MLHRTELPGAVDDRLFLAQVCARIHGWKLIALKGRPDGPTAIVSSAGCTALSLLADGATEVIGVDLIRAQHHLVELKAAAVTQLGSDAATALLGGVPLATEERLSSYQKVREALTPAAQRFWDQRPGAVARGVLQAGVTERLMRLIAGCVRRLVHPRDRIDRLLALRTVDDQPEFYAREWDTTPEGEARQADEVVRHCRTLLARPAVEAVTYWGLADGGWLGAPGGFIRADGSPKPSYQALHSLVKGERWLPPTTMGTDREGRLRLQGFRGEYEVSAAGTSTTFRLDEPGEVTVEVALGSEAAGRL